jgi:hypothetical protein
MQSGGGRMTDKNFIWDPAACTDVTIRFRKMGWVPPSEDPKYKKKWADFKAIMAKTIDDWTPAEKKEINKGTLTLAEFRKRK